VISFALTQWGHLLLESLEHGGVGGFGGGGGPGFFSESLTSDAASFKAFSPSLVVPTSAPPTIGSGPSGAWSPRPICSPDELTVVFPPIVSFTFTSGFSAPVTVPSLVIVTTACSAETLSPALEPLVGPADAPASPPLETLRIGGWGRDVFS